MLAALLSAVHLLGLGLGLGSIWVRARALRAVAAGKPELGRVFAADNVWGLSAILWLGSGLTRLFLESEKGLTFYVYNGMFWAKMGTLALTMALEIPIMIALIQWRITEAKGGLPDTARAGLFARISVIETVLVLIIPFFAAMMARGLWLLS